MKKLMVLALGLMLLPSIASASDRFRGSSRGDYGRYSYGHSYYGGRDYGHYGRGYSGLSLNFGLFGGYGGYGGYYSRPYYYDRPVYREVYVAPPAYYYDSYYSRPTRYYDDGADYYYAPDVRIGVGYSRYYR